MRITPSSAVRALKRAAYRPRAKSPRTEKRVVNEFHKLYYYAKERTWKNNTFWMNVAVAKCPLDLWVYQEIINETKPDLIIETGTAYGGSALFLASICELANHGRIITVDVEAQAGRPEHPRIEYVSGSSTSEAVIAELQRLTGKDDRVMVILDSDHRAEHVRQELELYAPVVAVGCYLIVEDTNINGHPVSSLFGDGPMEAVEQFTAGNSNFVIDGEREKFFMTFNPKGYLRRVS
ncbi:MAG TPA: CmcI family methyltransferase [Pyrinomonadaceae bacterium]|nr:CmcI family methyltransferase [Pyrinomonadaceae bacterium]